MDEEKALGLFWDVHKDEIYFKVEISVGGKKALKKISLFPYLVINLPPSPDRLPPLVLTIIICLSIHAKTYNPLGVILPVKVIGNLLFR